MFDKSKFSWLNLLNFFLNIQPNMTEQENKGQKIYDLLYAKTKRKFNCVLYRKQRKNTFYKKRAF